jgi:hypothetical protein
MLPLIIAPVAYRVPLVVTPKLPLAPKTQFNEPLEPAYLSFDIPLGDKNMLVSADFNCYESTVQPPI